MIVVNNVNKTTTRTSKANSAMDAQRFRDGSVATARAKTASPDAGVITEWYAKEDLLPFTMLTKMSRKKERKRRPGKEERRLEDEEATRRC